MNRSPFRRFNAQQREGTRRCGVSLVELLVVMTMLAALLSCTTITLFRLLRAQSAGGRVLAESLTMSRLGRDLRRDAHAATRAELAGPMEIRQLTFIDANGEATTYTLGVEGVLRAAQSADGTALREEYRLGGARCELQLVDAERLVRLAIRQPRPPETGAGAVRAGMPSALPDELWIEAAVGGVRVADLERGAP